MGFGLLDILNQTTNGPSTAPAKLAQQQKFNRKQITNFRNKLLDRSFSLFSSISGYLEAV
jgi:hypothetical protein